MRLLWRVRRSILGNDRYAYRRLAQMRRSDQGVAESQGNDDVGGSGQQRDDAHLVSVGFLAAEHAPDRLENDLQIQPDLQFRDGRNDADWFHLRTMLSTTEAQLLNDKGQTVARSQPGVEAQDSDDAQRMDVRLRFSRDGEEDVEPRGGKRAQLREAGRKVVDGTKFVWEIPVETREVVVPFVFRDLPIPR